jgi:hypothetical protein
MKKVYDFYNALCQELDRIYFPKIKYYRDDKYCEQTHYHVELFNNGCIDVKTLIFRISNFCNVTTKEIEDIVNKYLIFEDDVIFYYNKKHNDIFAYFPNIKGTETMNMSYSHIGQHSVCCKEYVDGSRFATKEEYSSLKKELENIGYLLNVLNEKKD